ncbi:MAG: FHA domain-containing protein [Polyangiales bacterium]
MHKLVISDDEGKTTVVPLVRDEITIGRKEGNTIRLTERNVSRKHARLSRREGGFLIEDLGAYNGVKLNGRRVDREAALEAGDQLMIGDYLLVYEIEGKEKADVDVAMGDFEEPAVPARLVMLTPPMAGAEYALSRLPARIGRADETDIVVNHRSISREHAEFVNEEGVIVVRDLKSANGVRVNGEEIEEAALDDGDILDLGQVKFRFVGEGVDYAFDPEEASRVVASDESTGPSRAPMVAALFIVAIAVAVGAAIAAAGSRSNRQGQGETSQADEPISAERRGAELRAALEGCQRAVREQKWDEAVSFANRAFAIDQNAEAVHACRAEAAAGADSAAKFERGMTALRQNRADDAYFAFEELAPDSPFRGRPELAQARAAFVQHHLELARAATDPVEATRQANVVLSVEGISEAQAEEARTIAARAPATPTAPAGATPAETPEATEAAAEGQASPMARANICVRQGDYACVVRELEGRAGTPAQLAMLIDAYRRTGARAQAVQAARQFVERYPTDGRVPRLRNQYLGGGRSGSSGGAPTGGAAPEAAPPTTP